MNELVLTAVHDETPAIRVLKFQPNNNLSIKPYEPGAHLDFDLGEHGVRSYSLIDWPNDEQTSYTIAVQRENDGAGGSKAMHDLEVGELVKVSDAKNDFSLVETNAPILLSTNRS